MFRLLLVPAAAAIVLSSQTLSSVAVSPLAGAGTAATIAIAVSRTGDLQRLSTVRVLIHHQVNGSEACFVQHTAGSSWLSLRNDLNTAWHQPIMLGSASESGNKQCTVIASESSVVDDGALYTLTLKLQFSPSFAGRRLIWVQALDDAGLASAAWHYRAEWIVPATLSGTGSDCIRVDGSTGPCLASFRVDRFRISSPPAESFTLTVLPLVGAEPKVYRNGLLLMPEDDYTLTGRELTFAGPLIAGDVVQVEYWVP